MNRSKTLPALMIALVAALAPTSMSAGIGGDDPISDLEVGESSPIGGCDPAISTMSDPEYGREGFDFRVSNLTSTANTDYVVVDALAGGRKRQFFVAISLPPRSTGSYAVRYLTDVSIFAVRHCRQRPGTIVEEAGPICQVTGEVEPIE